MYLKKLLSLALVMSMAASMPVCAAKRKKISSVSVTIKGNAEPGELTGEEENLEVTSGGSKYSLSGYDFTNGNFQWYEDDIPELEVTLESEEGYYFNVTKEEQIKLHGDGAVFKKAKRENNGTTLILTFRLPALSEQVGTVDNLRFENGILTWDPASCAEEYEVRLLRNQSTPGGIQVVHGTSVDLNYLITAPGTYACRVRGINKYDHSIKGAWSERSSDYSPGNEVLTKNREEYTKYNKGTWEIVDGKWNFTGENGERPDGWIYYKNDWYCLKDGVAYTGEQQIDGTVFHFNNETAKLMRNVTTPDGTELDMYGKPYTVHDKSEIVKRPVSTGSDAESEEGYETPVEKEMSDMREAWLKFQGKSDSDDDDDDDDRRRRNDDDDD